MVIDDVSSNRSDKLLQYCNRIGTGVSMHNFDTENTLLLFGICFHATHNGKTKNGAHNLALIL